MIVKLCIILFKTHNNIQALNFVHVETWRNEIVDAV